MKFCVYASCKNLACRVSFCIAGQMGFFRTRVVRWRSSQEVSCPCCGYSMWVTRRELQVRASEICYPVVHAE